MEQGKPFSATDSPLVDFDAVCQQVRTAIEPARAHAISLHDENGDLLWLSESSMGPDEHNAVREAMESFADPNGAPVLAYDLGDARSAVLLRAVNGRRALVGAIMVVVDTRVIKQDDRGGIKIMTPKLQRALTDFASMRPEVESRSQPSAPTAPSTSGKGHGRSDSARSDSSRKAPTSTPAAPKSPPHRPPSHGTAHGSALNGSAPGRPFSTHAASSQPSQSKTLRDSPSSESSRSFVKESAPNRAAAASRPASARTHAPSSAPARSPAPSSAPVRAPAPSSSPPRTPAHSSQSARTHAPSSAPARAHAPSSAPARAPAPSSAPARAPTPASVPTVVPESLELSLGQSARMPRAPRPPPPSPSEAAASSVLEDTRENPREDTRERHAQAPVPPEVDRLHAALRRSPIALHVQRLIPLMRGSHLKRYEVLLRAKGDDAPNAAPQAMLKAAVENGLGSMIDRRVITELVGWLVHHPDVWQTDAAMFSVNLTATALHDEHFIKFVGLCLAKSSLPKSMIAFEVDVPTAIKLTSRVAEISSALHRLGCPMVLDDFALRTECFDLLRLPGVRYIKLAPDVTTKMRTDKLAQASITAVVQMARVLGMHTVAKRTETAAEQEWLTALGVDFVQSHAMSPPVAIETLSRAKSQS